MTHIDLTKLAQYENQYIATPKGSLTTVYASGKTVSQVEKELEKKDIRDAVIEFIPSLDKSMSPLCL